MALAPGQVVLVQYDDALFHQRLVCGLVDQNEWVVCSPDLDFFVEQLDLQNADLAAIRFYPPGGGSPPGVAAGQVYGFVAQTPLDIWDLVYNGFLMAVQERASRGLAPLGAALPVAPAAGGVAIACQDGMQTRFPSVVAMALAAARAPA